MAGTRRLDAPGFPDSRSKSRSIRCIVAPMTKLFKKAIEEARRLPPAEQDALGAIILEEIADEKRWARKFAETRNVLEAMVAEADAEIAAGEAYPLEFSKPK